MITKGVVMKASFFTGAYAHAGQESILRLEADFANKTFEKTLSFRGVVNPSWLLLHPDGKHLYSVQELNPAGLVSSYTILEDMLCLDSTLPSDGADPCHLSLNDTADLLFTANYTSGSLSVFRLGNDGSLKEQCAHLQYSGKGIHFTVRRHL